MSSSRPRSDSRRRSLAALGIATLCALSFAALVRWREARPPRVFGLQLELTVGDAGPKDAGVGAARGGGLALNSLTNNERAQLAGLLNDLADEAERRQNPFVEDLEGVSHHAELRARLRAWGPSFSAAAALAVGAWTSEDGLMTVRATETCAPRLPATQCLPVVRASNEIEPSERRARFFAWPIARAIVLRAAGTPQARTLAASLRDQLDREHTSIALALERAELHGLRMSPELLAILRATDRLMEVLHDAGTLSTAESDLLARLARSTAEGDEVPWLQLPEGAVLVVPRLGALATRDLFVAEVTQRAAESHVPFDWVYKGE